MTIGQYWNCNTKHFLAGQQRYFPGSYDQFKKFGGPCVYFHRECLTAREAGFLSHRHIEMLYATLTAWGLHRMGDTEKTKTKLTDWDEFQKSLAAQGDELHEFARHSMLDMSESEYADAVARLRPCYTKLKLPESDATIVVNSKAFFHLFPEFIPPIDRQYTIRFFEKEPEKWLNRDGKFNAIQLPSEPDAQFNMFHATCTTMKRLADEIAPALFEEQQQRFQVTAPKALDNAIVNYVRMTAQELRSKVPAIGTRWRTRQRDNP
jgi:hypothetical protein